MLPFPRSSFAFRFYHALHSHVGVLTLLLRIFVCRCSHAPYSHVALLFCMSLFPHYSSHVAIVTLFICTLFLRVPSFRIFRSLFIFCGRSHALCSHFSVSKLLIWEQRHTNKVFSNSDMRKKNVERQHANKQRGNSDMQKNSVGTAACKKGAW